MFIIIIIITIISFILLAVYISSMYENYKSQQSILDCQYTFNNINGETQYFDKDDVSITMKELISSNCHYSSIELKKNREILDSSKMVFDCWKKASFGKDIYGSIQNGKKICLLCGVIKSEENIPNFNKNFIKEIKSKKYDKLFEESNGAKNLNELFLLNENLIPEKIDKDNEILVIYYTSVPEINLLLNSNGFIKENLDRMEYVENKAGTEVAEGFIEFAKTLVNNGFSKSGFVVNKLTSFFSSKPEETISGVTLVSHKINKNTENLDFSQGEMIMDCGENFIIPLENK